LQVVGLFGWFLSIPSAFALLPIGITKKKPPYLQGGCNIKKALLLKL
jgi:hypothetical protein